MADEVLPVQVFALRRLANRRQELVNVIFGQTDPIVMHNQGRRPLLICGDQFQTNRTNMPGFKHLVRSADFNENKPNARDNT